MASAHPEQKFFKVLLTLSHFEDSSPVFFKVDGERFKDSRTLKLHVDTSYRVVLEFRPPMVLNDADFSGVSIKPELKRTDDACSVYEGKFSTLAMSPTKKQQRTCVTLSLKFSEQHELNTNIQSKMYPLKDKTHVMWGSCLKSMEYECKTRDGQSYVDVQKTSYR